MSEWLSASYNVVQAKVCLAPVSYKDSSLKVLFTFQVWARLFCRRMYSISLFSYLRTYCTCMDVSHAIPDDIKHFQHGGTRTLFRLHKLASPAFDIFIIALHKHFVYE